MTKIEHIDNWDKGELHTSVETYLRMSDREKDIEIQKAVDRLQKRIQAILYVIDKEMPSSDGSGKERRSRNPR